MTNKPRVPEVVRLPATFHAMKDHVVAVMETPLPGIEHATIGLRFESPEQLLEFFSKLIEKAAVVWPDNKWIKEYFSE
jgi:hypothetical protein